MVGQGTVDVQHRHVLGILGGKQKGGSLGIDAGVISIDEGDPGHAVAFLFGKVPTPPTVQAQLQMVVSAS
jgi:hypothetical protein